MRLLIATHNRGKLIEYRELFAGLALDLVTLDDVGIREDVEENGRTFAENARLKAQAYAMQSGVPTLADDSGLEVDALNGEPGIYSKRYAGEHATDAERNLFLLDKLREVPHDRRTARFQCAIAIARPGGEVLETRGTCEGEILFAPRGTHGFGYDPVFLFSTLGKTMAELTTEEKNRVSHRARAGEKAKLLLDNLIRDA